MTIAATLVLITADPNHTLAYHALRYVRSILSLKESTNSTQPINIFFYGEAAHTANKLRWQVADKQNLTHEWQKLATDHDMQLPVCVSTALTRGVTDHNNAQRHQLAGDNLAEGFQLVGLGDLADKLNSADKVIQF